MESVVIEHVRILHADEYGDDRDVEFGGKFESSGLKRPGFSVVKPHGQSSPKCGVNSFV